MSKKLLAITTCRVSTPEQEKNGSLDRQALAVLKAAEELGVDIPEDGQWSGNVSSKAGTNVKRKDLKQMLDYCRKHRNVKYLIVHEVDRFMRSLDELFYFEVIFREEVGVKIIYASQPDLNSEDYKAKLFKAFEAFKGEGSNVERIVKSIDGQTGALEEGRYPFHPKAGYRRGYIKGVPEIHEERGPALRNVLIRIATKRVTPTEGLIELNNSDYTKTRAPLKMDKFREKAVDPFYAGIVEIDKQVKVSNPNGLHEPLISLEHHKSLIEIFSNKKKTQSGPLKDGNPDFPCNNIVSCDLCTDKTNGRYVGFKHSNGKNPNLVYAKYRCRGCGRYLSSQEMHEKIRGYLYRNPITEDGVTDLKEALETVWKEEEVQTSQDITRIKHKIESLEAAIKNQVEAATDPSNAAIKQDILESIKAKKSEIEHLEEQLVQLQEMEITDKTDFLDFAFDFAENTSSRFLEISKQNRLVCKQLLFPAGFYLDNKNKVYTPEISPLYRLATNKKDAEASNLAQMVRVQGLKPWTSSLARKRSIN